MKPYFFVRDGQQAGPVLPEQFRLNGVSASTPVWCEGMPDWVPAGQIPELQPYLSYPSAPATYATGGYSNEPAPSSNMVWAILSTILCCLPFGIVAIIYASKVDSMWAAGQFDAARDAARKAMNWSIAAAVSAVVVSVIYIIFWVVVFAANL